MVQDVHRTLTAAQPGQAVGHRVTGHGGGLPRRVGQGEPGRQPGREHR